MKTAAVAALAALVLGACSATSESSPTTSSPSPASVATSAASTTATATPLPLQGKVVVIDPGHNGGNGANPRQINRQVDAGFGVRKACNTTGTETNDGYPEHTQVWDVSQRLAALLRVRGATVILTRDSDTGVGPCIDVRGAAGGRARADAVLSIHADGAGPNVRGFHVAVATRMLGGEAVVARSRALAEDVRQSYERGTGMPRAGGGSGLSPRSDLGTLNLSTVPTVLLESGNMRNATDAQLLTDPGFRQREAVALAQGVSAFLSRA